MTLVVISILILVPCYLEWYLYHTRAYHKSLKGLRKSISWSQRAKVRIIIISFYALLLHRLFNLLQGLAD